MFDTFRVLLTYRARRDRRQELQRAVRCCSTVKVGQARRHACQQPYPEDSESHGGTLDSQVKERSVAFHIQMHQVARNTASGC